MDYRTFQATTMSAALAVVKQELGPTAVILQTRSFTKNRWLGLRRQEIFEITAGRDARGGNRQVRQIAARPAPMVIKPPAEMRRQLMETPVVQNAAIAGIFKEVSGLRTVVEELATHVNRSMCPNIPDELFAFYSQLIENQVAQELATSMIKTIQKQIRPEHARQADFVRAKLAEQIEKNLPAAGPIIRTKTAASVW